MKTLKNKKEAVKHYINRIDSFSTADYDFVEALKDYLAQAQANAVAGTHEFDLAHEIGCFLEEKEEQGFIFYPLQVEA